MKHTTTLIALLLFMTQQVTAQNYTIDWTYERSGNARIKQNDKAGLIDSNKKIIIPALYDEVTDFYNGFARVIKNGKVGFVNKQAQEIIPCMYEADTLKITGAEMIRTMRMDDPVVYLMVGTVEYRTIESEDLFCVTNKNGKYGFVDAANKTIIPFQFEGADNFFDSIAIVIVNNKYGAIDHKGTIVIPCEYDKLVWEFRTSPHYFIYASKNGKSFWIDKKGNLVEE